MSSYWGHGSGQGQVKERKHSFRGPSRRKADRRASLPCPSQLDAMHLNRLHAAAVASAPVHPKVREETEARLHPRAQRVPSDDNSCKSAVPAPGITTIPELTESFEKRLYVRNQKILSLGGADNICLLCREDKRSEAAQELHCSHRFHKECLEQWGWKEHACPLCKPQ